MLLAEYSLLGRTVLITGAGRGIGAGIAEVLAEAGATLAINALTDIYLTRLAASLSRPGSQRIVPIAGDVSTSQGADSVVSQARSALGHIDIMINNLGDALERDLVPLSEAPVLSTDDEARRMIGLNLMSAIYCSRAVGREMIGRRSGKVLNIASFAALRGAAHMSLYAAAKSALMGLTRSLAVEWAPYGINVNAIAPGVIPDRVTFAGERYSAIERHYKALIPLGRLGSIREVGLLALYLVSDASSYMTGQIVALDGGLSA